MNETLGDEERRQVMWNLRFIVTVAALTFAAASPAQTPPGNYPEKPVKIIVPFAPAGPTDVVARLIATKLSERLGRQFYIENVTGAGGNTGMGQAARSAPDGYTILFVSSSYVVNPSLYPKIPYDPYKDFIPVTVAGDAPNILLVHPSVPAKAVGELIDYIRANPGKVSYASAGTGTTPHLSGELFRLSMKLDIVHVPFGGAGPAIQSLAGGHTPMAFTSLPPAIPLIQDGKIRPLAVSAEKRVAALPDVPTLAEAGLADQEADNSSGRAGAGRYATPDRRLPLPRDQDDRRSAGHQGTFYGARPRSGHQYARGICNADQERDRQVGKGDPRREYQD